MASLLAGGMAACSGAAGRAGADAGLPGEREPDGAPLVDRGADAGDARTVLGGEAGDDGSVATGHDSGIPTSSEDGAAVGDADAHAEAAADAAADVCAAADAGDAADANLDASDGHSETLGVDCSPSAGGKLGTTGAPALLACTGLYSDFPARTITAGVTSFEPGVALWSDGAEKRRFILLPPGTKINTSIMDEWKFPVGTKLWKEFSLSGKPVETRYLYKTSAGWVWTTYQWSPDQTTATELTTGATNLGGTTYEIPDHEACRTCHEGREDFVLGFEAIGLSMPMAKGLTMSALVAGGWVTDPPSAPLTIPGDATASAALGWLHANCGNACHSPSTRAVAGWTGFYMRLSASSLGSVQSTATYTTGVNVVSGFNPSDAGAFIRIAPGNPSRSCVIVRDSYRDTHGEGVQMPPIDTHVVDTADVATVTKWIQSL